MSKRLDKVAKIEERMSELANQRKQELQKHKQEERRARTKRLCSRHGLLEKHMPNLISITDEQFEAFIKRGINTSYGQKILAEIIAKAPKTVENSIVATTAQKSNTAEPQQASGTSGNATQPQTAAKSGAN